MLDRRFRSSSLVSRQASHVSQAPVRRPGLPAGSLIVAGGCTHRSSVPNGIALATSAVNRCLTVRAEPLMDFKPFVQLIAIVLRARIFRAGESVGSQ